jgi:tetratricopeptide (TPR) repeat protein
MRKTVAIILSVGVGLGLAAWIERDRLADLVARGQVQLGMLDGSVTPAELPAGEVPDAGQSQPAMPNADPVIEEGPQPVAVPTNLDDLFAALRQADSLEQAQPLETAIFMQLGAAPNGTVAALMEAAARADDAEDWARSRKIYSDAIALAPEFADGWARLAASAWQMGDHASAITHLKHALTIEPRHFAALSGLATIYEEVGAVEEADQAWREALYWHPLLDGAKRGAARTGAKLRGVAL